MNEILKTDGLTKIFESGQRAADAAVDSVSFQIREGETLGLVGESGCGKSTLARLITRLIDPSAGTIRLNGIDITKAKGKALREAYRQMQMVFQSPMASFDPRRPIGYGIGEALKNSGVPKAERKQRVAGLLEQCDLSPAYARRYPHELSGGQCQRAAIARALAVRPRLLICDEATSSLDVMAQHQIVELLRTLKQTNRLSILFISHNLALVQSFCDRVLVMHEGKMVEEGTPDQVIRSPQSDYTKRMVEAAF